MRIEHALTDLLDFSLLDAINGRRSRRFGLGMEIPSGPLAYESESDPVPLTEMEQAVLVAAGTGVPDGTSVFLMGRTDATPTPTIRSATPAERRPRPEASGPRCSSSPTMMACI